ACTRGSVARSRRFAGILPGLPNRARMRANLRPRLPVNPKGARPMPRHSNIVVTIALMAGLLSACSQEDGDAVNSQPQPPPATVAVVTVAAEAVPVINELPGRIAPTRIAEVRPRVSGIVVERVFEQGSMVKEGDVLYRIDP